MTPSILFHRLLPSALVLAAFFGSLPAARAALVNRWSFNEAAGATTAVDSVGAQHGTIRGVGAAFSGGGTLTLPGTSDGTADPATISAYVDLPNNLLAGKTNLTVEAWVAPLSSQSWQRLFDFGRIVGAGDGAAGEVTGAVASGSTQASDQLMLAMQRSTDFHSQRAASRINGGTQYVVDSGLSTAANTYYHYVLTFAAGVGAFPAGGRISSYRDGALLGTVDAPFALSSIEDVNNWLGRSQWSNDRCSNVRYNEFRIYNHVLSAGEIAASRAAGENPAAPTVAADAVTMHRLQKAAIPVRANDLRAVTLTVVQAPQWGTAVPDAAGRIVYTHTTGAPASDSFTYHASNAAGQSGIATVTITFASGMRFANTTFNVPATPPATAYQLEPAFSGLTFSQPVCMRTPPGETQRLFVCQKGGLVRVIPNVSAATPTISTFLNLPTDVLTPRGESIDTGGECGLLSIAFHPLYASNRQFFVFYSVNKGGQRYQRVSRFLTKAALPNEADPATERVFIEQLDEASNHNGGDLHFGADGYLYISVGDEGDQNDFFDNSQRIDKDFFSAILRLDVNLEGAEIPGGNAADPDDTNVDPTAHASIVLVGGKPAFEVPLDNPYVHTSVGGTWTGSYNGVAIANLALVRREIYATGLRNPWRFSFDPPTGKLWCGDVGGGEREEVDIITKGGNYGWAYREGTIAGPKSGTALGALGPLHEYGHGSGTTQGNSITGGFVYRGSRFPALQTRYFFADHVSGNIWTIAQDGSGVQRLLGEGYITAFAPDPSNGDVLLADYDGPIHRLVTGTPAGYPLTLTDTGLFADTATLAPAPGVLPYTVNLAFWSDYALKSRWFTIPNGTSDMTWSRDGLWTYPSGMIWVKHFDLELTRGNAATKKRIETRLIVRNATGAYGVSYRWNDAQNEAMLVPDEGVEFDLSIVENGTPRTQRWQIPSRSQCVQCHTPQAGHALSFTTRQLNGGTGIGGFPGNQLDLLRTYGYFTNTPDSTNLLPRHLAPNETAFPVEARVRSYLAVNCAYCHKTGGTASPAAWDGRPELTLTQTGLINGVASNNGGSSDNKLVVPDEPGLSIVYNRMAVAPGFTRMPPLATRELDQTNIALVYDWIENALEHRETYDRWRLTQFGSASSPEGEPTENADADAADNRTEFLAGTAPLNGASVLAPAIAGVGPNITLQFQLPENRSFQIETSTDLTAWSLWDVSGNQGLPHTGAPITITGPRLDPAQFFRVRLWEN